LYYHVDLNTTDLYLKEIRGRRPNVICSERSDMYALGCVLYRLCTLEELDQAARVKPLDISPDYSVDLLSLIGSMPSYDRVDRPTAIAVKHHLLQLIRRYLDLQAKDCRRCR
jgi:serine/threonine protein kinase